MADRFVFAHVPDPEHRRYVVVDTAEPSMFGGQLSKAVVIAECVQAGHAERLARSLNAHPDIYDPPIPNGFEFMGPDHEQEVP